MKKILYALLLLLPAMANAQMTTRVVKDNLFIPWEMVYGPDNHIWLTQKNGYICRLDPTNGDMDTLYHETRTVIQSEGGMLGLALHPDFANNPYVYVAYEYMNGGAYTERIARYTYSSSSNTLSGHTILFDDIKGANYHNGCRLLIVGDKLFITTGDATTASVAQDVNEINGKILRINLDASIPTDNPMAPSPVWSFGHRNPQGIVYANSKLYESEHGPNNDDEVNIIQTNRNYGWPNVEGYCNTPSEITFCNNNNVVEPLMAWTPTIAVSDIDYYDHPMFPALKKSLIMATLKDKKLYQLKLNGTLDGIASTATIAGLTSDRIRAICIGPDGNIFISTSNSNADGSTQIDKIIEIYDPSYSHVATLANSSAINIYPNPGHDIINIKMPAVTNELRSFRITNIQGALLMHGQLPSNSSMLDISQLPGGLYFIKTRDTKGTTLSGKIIKH
jgi:glucose/arabinose dehydrogenase